MKFEFSNRHERRRFYKVAKQEYQLRLKQKAQTHKKYLEWKKKNKKLKYKAKHANKISTNKGEGPVLPGNLTLRLED